jgi:phosphotransferase system IIB component
MLNMIRTRKFPANSQLYRGSSKVVKNSNNISYFIYGNNAIKKVEDLYVKYQGNRVYEYKTNRPMNLVMMNNKQSVQFLMNTTENQNVKKAIQETFRLNNSKNVKRNSNANLNRVVARHICAIGYDGYIANEMKKGNGNNVFHREVILCKPHEKIRYVGNFAPMTALMAKKKAPLNLSPPHSPVQMIPMNRVLTNNNFRTP